jgi:hypothetical protein
MKNKESKINKTGLSRKNSAVLTNNNASQIKEEESIQANINRHNKVTMSQINRIKRFYNTTRWLPNSSFTTFFGKPAFENYGFGNTKPTYGGLFYGNYMLSHNINPVDGENLPEEKQVYASCMLKASKANQSRKPEPPRKVPEEIRNTPEELNEIKGRNPVFQKPNNFQNREIMKPNLIRARYFRSPKGTPKKDKLINQDLYERGGDEFDIEGLLDGKEGFKKKKKVVNSKADGQFYAKELKKKVTKEQIDNKNPEYLKALKKGKDEKDGNIEDDQKEQKNKENERLSVEDNQKEADPTYLSASEAKILKEKMKDFYEKMLDDKDNDQKQVDKDNINQNSSIINANQITQAPDTSLCSQYNKDYRYQGESVKVNIKKKENPCLMPSNEFK